MKNDKTQVNDNLDRMFDQVDMVGVGDDIKEWLLDDMKIHEDEDVFNGVTREEEFKAVKETISDVMMER
ncbi:hypothetical protein BTO30_00540 [Domibacillus antri]|uniref:Uncharacterized protein n=1 Tax=Domibacillus antri TaxID=1714264 RepID=A0A1Q8Q9G7_9BACI|nr:hypothetical protein [Domibacillus antri]OLN23951.1 hypothetical protein BTO30_00540 [Domibacillus antri]